MAARAATVGGGEEACAISTEELQAAVEFLGVSLRISPPIESPDVDDVPAEGSEDTFTQDVAVAGGGSLSVAGAV